MRHRRPFNAARMNSLLILAVGFGAAFGTTAAWFPQVGRTWNTRSARDFSWGYLALFMLGVFLWTMYGVLRHDVVRRQRIADPQDGSRVGRGDDVDSFDECLQTCGALPRADQSTQHGEVAPPSR